MKNLAALFDRRFKRAGSEELELRMFGHQGVDLTVHDFVARAELALLPDNPPTEYTHSHNGISVRNRFDGADRLNAGKLAHGEFWLSMGETLPKLQNAEHEREDSNPISQVWNLTALPGARSREWIETLSARSDVRIAALSQQSLGLFSVSAMGNRCQLIFVEVNNPAWLAASHHLHRDIQSLQSPGQ